MNELEKKKKRHLFPIRVKTVLMIVAFGLALAEVAMVFFTLTSSNNNKSIYKSIATDLAQTVASAIDKEKTKNITEQAKAIYESYDGQMNRSKEGTEEFEIYLAKFDAIKATQDYKDIQKFLYDLKVANHDTDGIYLGYTDLVRKQNLYVAYDTENEVYPVGMVDDLYEEDYPIIDDPMIGFVASIYETEVGGEYLCTAGSPVLDSEGNIICYALVDISMATVRSKQANSIVRLFIYLVASVLLLSLIGIFVVHFTLVKPVKAIEKVTKSYDVNNPEKTHEIFSKLEVKVNDEFSDLAESLRIMENDINTKINELIQTNEALVASRQVASEMTELANKDGLTGVRNKIAYDSQCHELNKQIANKENIEFAIVMIDLNYLKNINDEYGHDNGDSALIKLCNIVCTIFAHSSVFRVGGDEFVVILKGRDYKRAEELVHEFNTKIDGLRADDELLPAEKVSAAIGYSKYDKNKDTCVEDVFKRADKAMYQRKRIMKTEDKDN